MYRIETIFEISSAHKLELDYPSPCSNFHGHNWKIHIYCVASILDHNGMVIDFAKIKKAIKSKLDHQTLNNILDRNPTAENIARFIGNYINYDLHLFNVERDSYCERVDVEETSGNTASWFFDKQNNETI